MNTPIVLMILVIAVVIAGLVFLVRGRRRPRQGLPAGVPVRYTSHARDRMRERGVSAAQVEAVLADPARHIPDLRENSIRLERDFDDRILKVWVVAPWPATRESVVKSTAWKYLATLTVPPAMVGRVIGAGGATIQQIRDEAGANIAVSRDGTIRISAGDPSSLDAARLRILAIAEGPTSPRPGSTSSRRGGENMAKHSTGGNPGKSGSNSRGVSSARLHQKSGSSNAFGGCTKLSNPDGTFRMRKST